MPLILSTKVLPFIQKRHLFYANFSLVEYNAVRIKELDFNLKADYVDHAIFTSQNAVKIALEKNLSFKNVFCVGEKTAALLSSNGIKPKRIERNAKSLAKEIVKTYSETSFDFFCSAQRRDELPHLFTKHEIKFTEHHLYQSLTNKKHFTNDFDAVLCFSPLGVKAYYENHHKTPTAICIGETTAEEARVFSSKVLVANKTSLESVIYKSIKALK